MGAPPNLLKLCVGAVGVQDLADWQTGRAEEARRAGRDPRPVCTTRLKPKRAAELLQGGSLYWVFRGLILARQRIVEFSETDDAPPRCAMILDPDIVRVEPRPRAPFQGWRYLEASEAPRDIARGEGFSEEAALPPTLAHALAEIGVRRAT